VLAEQIPDRWQAWMLGDPAELAEQFGQAGSHERTEWPAPRHFGVWGPLSVAQETGVTSLAH
jgi:hypothetical protein